MKNRQRVLGLCALLFSAFQSSPLLAQTDASTVVGKNDWLYFRWERLEPSYAPEYKKFVELLKKVNRLFQESGTEVLFTVTPLKMQVYPENLPAGFQVAPGMKDHYAQFVGELRAGGGYAVDQLSSFVAHANDNPALPLFLRLDSHWSPSGAVLAARNIKEGVMATPALRQAWESLPVVKYQMELLPNPITSKTTDLLANLPKEAAVPPPDKIANYNLVRSGAAQLDSDETPGITAIGSSFTHKMTQYPNALRHELQRDILDISIPGRQGPWVGMETYVTSLAFQLQRPKLLIWEIPHRDVSNTPNSPWREERYRRDNTDWLIKVATNIKKTCNPSPVSAKVGELKLSENGLAVAGQWVAGAISGKEGYLEVQIDQATEQLDYLSLDFSAKGSFRVRFEGFAANGKRDEWTLAVPFEGEKIALKSALQGAAGHYQKIRVYPGAVTELTVGQPKVCRHDASLLVLN